jgi:hypothetical protein
LLRPSQLRSQKLYRQTGNSGFLWVYQARSTATRSWKNPRQWVNVFGGNNGRWNSQHYHAKGSKDFHPGYGAFAPDDKIYHKPWRGLRRRGFVHGARGEMTLVNNLVSGRSPLPSELSKKFYDQHAKQPAQKKNPV